MSTGRCSIAARRIRAPEPVLRPPAFGVVLISQGHEVGGGDARYDVGTYADIAPPPPRRSGGAELWGGNRFRVVE